MLKAEPSAPASGKFSKRRAVGGGAETDAGDETQDTASGQRTDWWADGEAAHQSDASASTVPAPAATSAQASSGASIHNNIAQRIQQQQSGAPAPVFAVPQHPITHHHGHQPQVNQPYHPIDFNELLPTRPDLRPRVINENQKRVAELSDSFEQYLRLMDVPADPHHPLSLSGIERMFPVDPNSLLYNPMTGGIHIYGGMAPQQPHQRPTDSNGSFQPLPELTPAQLRSLLPNSISLSDIPYEQAAPEQSSDAAASATSPRDGGGAPVQPAPGQPAPAQPKANLMLADISQRLQQQVDNTPVPQPLGSPNSPQQLAQLQTAQMLLARHAIMQQHLQQQMAQAAQLQQAHQQQQRQPQQMQQPTPPQHPHLQMLLQQQQQQQVAVQQSPHLAQQHHNALQLQMLQQANNAMAARILSATPTPSSASNAPQLPLALRAGTPAPAVQMPSGMPRLLIEEQPTPKSLWKKRRIVPPFMVRMMPGIMGVKARGPVQAYLVTDSPEKIELSNGSEMISDEGVALFDKMQFSKGSHQHLVQIYFEMQVTTGDEKVVTITTPSSEPFIICTNINQWIASEKKIFKKICFGEESQVAWELFRANLQSHFTRALGCTRSLSVGDLDYVHGRVGNRLQITQHAFNEFWDWYGPILKEIYEKTGHWRSIWERNMIYGFLGRATAEQLLLGQPDGTFVISFAENRLGMLGIYHVVQGVPTEYSLTVEERQASFREFLVNSAALQALLCPPTDASGKSEVVSKTKLLREFRPPRPPKGGAADPAGAPPEED